MLAAVTVFVVILYSVDWSIRKPFLRDLARVDVGMTEAEVRRVMGGYLEGTGLVDPPGTPPNTTSTLTVVGSGSHYPITSSSIGEVRMTDSLVFRHSADSADWGIVRFSNGKVVDVEFSPD